MNDRQNHRKLYPWAPWIAWVVGAPLAGGILGLIAFDRISPDTMPVDNPDLWWLAFAVPLAGLGWIYGTARRHRAVRRFASAELTPLLATRVSASRPAFRAGLTVLSVGLLVVAVLGPRWGTYLSERKVRGVDVIVALDVSRSMLADDVTPTRLARAKREIRQQLTERAVFRQAHRLGLLLFAGSTSLRVPLTTDHLAFRTQLENAGVGSVPRGGTALAEAIGAAADLFRASPEQATKVLLLFTDGEDHEGGAIEAALTAHEEQGIMVFTIGVGDPDRTFGAQVPIAAGRRERPLLHDGQIVFSKLDVPGLREIAESAGGRYAAIQDFPRLVSAIAELKHEELATERRKLHKPRYQWFVALALLCLGLETITRQCSSRPDEGPRRVWEQEKVSP